MGVQPRGDLVAPIEQTTGEDVAVVEADGDEHGLAMKDSNTGAVFVAVARTRHPMRQRSILAHELGHLVFGDWDPKEVLSSRSPAEIRADAFARHLLVPREGPRAFLGDRRPATEAELSDVVQHFVVSPGMAAIAMRDSGYVDEGTRQDWVHITTPQLATRFGWSDFYKSLQADSDRPRAPQQLLARAIEGYSLGVVSAQMIATIRSANEGTVLAELEDAGIYPTLPEPVQMDADALPHVEIDFDDLDTDETS